MTLDDRLCAALIEMDDAPASPLESFLEGLAHLAAVPGTFCISHQAPHPDVVAWAKERACEQNGIGATAESEFGTWWRVPLAGEGVLRYVVVLEAKESSDV